MKTNDLNIPSFKREECKIGIVHLGVGNFHRAHQALYINNYIDELINFVQVCPKEMLDKLDNPITLKSIKKVS